MFQGPVINQFSLESLIMWKKVLTIIHVAINVHSPCFHVLMRMPQLDRGISHVGKGTPDRKRNLEGGRKSEEGGWTGSVLIWWF